MPKIQILNDTLASQVAAGEVVERPASVVKELVENSLDAGAKHITVEIQRGGSALVRVTDDGCGMSREDAMMSLERHATSKLRDSEGLASILTLGFRGEAVPSIASIARFKLSTREQESAAGTEILIDGGTLKDVRDAGGPAGTCVEAKQIFFNVPARRKFLRAETTESAHVEHQVRLHALASPEVRFTFIKDGRTVFDLAATQDWRVRISGLAGSDAAAKLIKVEPLAARGMQIKGHLLPAEFARKGRRQQFIFLNGRPIEDTAISRALRDGYRGAVSEGSHPAAWIWLEIDPSLVDVNVHPAKKEVRFHRPHEVRALVASAVEQALKPKIPPPAPQAGQVPNDFMPGPAVSQSEEFKSLEGKLNPSIQTPQLSPPTREFSSPHFPHKAEQQQEFVDPQGAAIAEQPEFKLIGPLHDRYIVLQGDEGVVLLDPVAARERVVYEELLTRANSSGGNGIDAQGLLVPELLELEALDADLVMRHAGHFADAGMTVEAFGGNTVKVSSVPCFLNVSDLRAFLLEFVDELNETVGARKAKTMAYEAFAAGLARRLGRREPCRIDHADILLASMFACDMPYCTPDGRPTIIHISLTELDRKFGR